MYADEYTVKLCTYLQKYIIIVYMNVVARLGAKIKNGLKQSTAQCSIFASLQN